MPLQSRCHVGESAVTLQGARLSSPPIKRAASVFELKLLESDESEDTARASHARVFRWAVRIGTYAAIWLAFRSVGAQAAPRRAGADQVRYRLPPGTHVWCDRASGRCGVHDARHHEVRLVVP